MKLLILAAKRSIYDLYSDPPSMLLYYFTMS